MKINGIDVFANGSKVCGFDLVTRSALNPYVLKASTGLDADNIIPRFYGAGLVSNTKYYDLALEPREIVLRIGLDPNYVLGIAPADLRDDIYRAVAASRDGLLQLRFLIDGVPYTQIKGFVTKLEAPHFNREPEVQITMLCDPSMITGMEPTEVIVDDLDLILPVINDPLSTAPHGFKFSMSMADGTWGESFPFTIKDAVTPDWQFRLTYAFQDDDVLYFSSEMGNKYIYVVRDAEEIPIMDTLITGSVWPIIFPGVNEFILSNVDPDNMDWIDMSYTETHWGI